ncbi:MAG TPA: CYTH domain-containing protein [Candidatus Acidoferrales bacterium]|nr:CYTH domain-containing protein [Candidatus Acidoferrales bacterium]
MANEIERKFLVRPRNWSELGPGLVIRQGYLSTDNERTVRVRTSGDLGYITIKGITKGISRKEYEYKIPLAEANELLDRMCLRPLIEKTRFRIPFGGHTFEVDEFTGDNRGLTVAEVELNAPGEKVDLPDWIDREVSDDPRYFNSNLSQHPYTTWDKSK